jgi:hypothetical protein
VHIEAKPFSIGVRIEHPQSLIDRARFGKFAGHPLLGAADYKLVHHCGNGRSAYSFCMCPGGTVVAATSEPGRVVTNGMSQYSRNERNANAALVVGVTPADYPGIESDPLAGIEFQRHWESLAFTAGGGDYARRRSASAISSPGGLPPRSAAVLPSYTPGVRRPTCALPARLRGGRAARIAAGLRPPDPRLRHGRRPAHRRRDAHLVADPHHARQRFPEPQHARPVSGRRRRRLRRRHPFGGGRRHQGRRGRGAQPAKAQKGKKRYPQSAAEIARLARQPPIG